jgi:hypothetical protein
LSTLTPSQPRPRRLLAMLAIALGVLAAALILATLVLVAVDGHPEGLLAAAVCATVPAMLWGTRRLLELVRSARASRPSRMARLEIKLEPTSAQEIRGPRILALS